jgi:hypothetical protein
MKILSCALVLTVLFCPKSVNCSDDDYDPDDPLAIAMQDDRDLRKARKPERKCPEELRANSKEIGSDFAEALVRFGTNNWTAVANFMNESPKWCKDYYEKHYSQDFQKPKSKQVKPHE